LAGCIRDTVSIDETIALERGIYSNEPEHLYIENKSWQVFACNTIVLMQSGMEAILKYSSDRNGTNDTCNEPAELKPKRELHTTAEAFHFPCTV
jgi:hypothetical protein